jgi:hypothetical protein
VNYLPRLAADRDPPDLCLLSSWDYRRESLVCNHQASLFPMIHRSPGHEITRPISLPLSLVPDCHTAWSPSLPPPGQRDFPPQAQPLQAWTPESRGWGTQLRRQGYVRDVDAGQEAPLAGTATTPSCPGPPGLIVPEPTWAVEDRPDWRPRGRWQEV